MFLVTYWSDLVVHFELPFYELECPKLKVSIAHAPVLEQAFVLLQRPVGTPGRSFDRIRYYSRGSTLP